MKFITEATITDQVIDAMQGTPDTRLREVCASLVKHLHAFVREVKPSVKEFEHGCEFMVALGQSSSAKKNEVILALDILGVSALVTLLNDAQNQTLHDHDKTDAALLGPFWRSASPSYPSGGNIARGQDADSPEQVMLVCGVVRDPQGHPVADALVDVWQASPRGLYENQDDTQPDMNLRGRFMTDADGYYCFRTVRPAGYPVPVDGPCGDLLRAQHRDPYRPAHIHFMASKPGHQVLVTQAFSDDDPRLATDVAFSVMESLVGHIDTTPVVGSHHFSLNFDMVLHPGETLFPIPPLG